MEYIYETKPIVDRCTHQPKIVFVYVSFVFLISHFLIRIPSSVLYFVISNGRYENKKKNKKKKNMNSHAFSIYSLTRDMRRVGMRRVVCVCVCVRVDLTVNKKTTAIALHFLMLVARSVAHRTSIAVHAYRCSKPNACHIAHTHTSKSKKRKITAVCDAPKWLGPSSAPLQRRWRRIKRRLWVSAYYWRRAIGFWSATFSRRMICTATWRAFKTKRRLYPVVLCLHSTHEHIVLLFFLHSQFLCPDKRCVHA